MAEKRPLYIQKKNIQHDRRRTGESRDNVLSVI
jgi:hypothetical protein